MLVFAGSCDEDAGREREFIGALRARRVDGIIVVPAGPDHGYLLPEVRLGTPIVFVDRPPRFLDADSVTSDDHGGTFMAVSHLVERGHDRIAYLGADLAIATAEARLRGYSDALGAHGLDLQSAIVRTGLRSVEDAERCVAEIFSDGAAPTALVSAQNYFTIGAYKGLRTRDLWGRVAVVGFDDFPLAEMLDPPVTVVAHDPVELGLTAAQLLFRRLDGDRSASEHIVCSVQLVPRGSGEIEPVAA
jgi:LacI family transcriptional regulator